MPRPKRINENPEEKPIKKKRRRLTKDERRQIIEKGAAGLSVGRIAQDLDIASEAVAQVLKPLGDLFGFNKVEDGTQSPKKRDLIAVEKSILRWFEQQIALGQQIELRTFKSKALEFNHEINNDEVFKASNCWLDGFKKRNNILNFPIDSIDPNTSTETKFCNKVAKIVTEKNISLDDFYNVDETLVAWRTLPISKNQQPEPGIDKIDIVSIIACCNASGTHKIPLAIVGKENLNLDKSSDFIYFNQAEGLVDEKVFTNWFQTIFLEEVKQKERKCFLLLDNAPPHYPRMLDKEEESCEILRLGVEISPLVQPIREIINHLKIEYRTRLMNEFETNHANKSKEVFSRSLELKTACQLLATSWNQIEPKVLESIWIHSMDSEESKYEIEFPKTFIDTVKTLPGCSRYNIKNVQEWFAQDEGHPWKVLSDDEIIQKAKVESEKIEIIEEEKKWKKMKDKIVMEINKSLSTDESITIKEEVIHLDDPDLVQTDEEQCLDFSSIQSETKSILFVDVSSLTVENEVEKVTTAQEAHEALDVLERFYLGRKIVHDQYPLNLIKTLREDVRKHVSKSK